MNYIILAKCINKKYMILKFTFSQLLQYPNKLYHKWPKDLLILIKKPFICTTATIHNKIQKESTKRKGLRKIQLHHKFQMTSLRFQSIDYFWIFLIKMGLMLEHPRVLKADHTGGIYSWLRWSLLEFWFSESVNRVLLSQNKIGVIL